MRILFTIPHYFNAQGGGRYGSRGPDPRPRLAALTACITALHQLFGRAQCMIDVARRFTIPVNQGQVNDLDIVICTTQDCHLLPQLPLPPRLFVHYPTRSDPWLLGFECQAVLRDNFGQYDYYCYLEDDLIVHDPWLFIKLNWFTSQAGDEALLQPSRYEVGSHGPIHKVYVDGDLAPEVTAPFQSIGSQTEVIGQLLGTSVTFRRALNPHAGCYFLNARQMGEWLVRPYFLDREARFIGPLESAATLGVMRTFHIYKAIPSCASFLEIEHFGTGFMNLIGREVRLGAS